jgi:hypothetical protein
MQMITWPVVAAIYNIHGLLRFSNKKAAMLERRMCLLLLLALLPLLGRCTIVLDEEDLMALSKEELAAHISGLLSRPGAAVTVDDLPAQRPPVYWMCDYNCMKTVDVNVNHGVFTLDMT